MAAPRTEIDRRELVLLAVGACVLSVVMHWPLVLHLGTDVPKDLGDPLVQAWQAAWGGHALADQPLDFFQSNQFWPLDDTLAFSDALVGYAPAGLVGSGPEAAIARYDVLFLFAYALAFAGAYLLARELGLGPGAAAAAGAAFAFAPFRLEQDGHLHIVSSGGIPLALALALRGYRLGRPVPVVAGFCVAAWQVAIGFSLGLPFAYLLAVLGLLAAVVWWRRGRPAPPRRLVVATLAGMLVFAATAAVLSRPYARVQEEHPNIVRTPQTIENFSGQPQALLVAPDENTVWAGATAGLREDLLNVPEKTLFPGLVTLALAIAGLATPVLSRGLRIGLAAGVIAITALALGFRVEDGLLWPYRIAYEVLPGFEGIRVPGRLVTFSSLGLALLAGAGAEAAGRALASRPRADRGPRGAWAPAAVVAAAVLALLIEGRGLPFDPGDDHAQPTVPTAPASFAAIPAPQLHLPAERPEDNRRYLLWSTDGFPDMVNGRSSLDPVFTAELIADVRAFPDRASVELLRELGVRSVVLHSRRLAGTPWERAPRRRVAGLPLMRERRGEVVVYEILSPGASAVAGTDTAGSALGALSSR